jgi:D-cysteine desulfhydrase/L-cysteate sulfo-lyase
VLTSGIKAAASAGFDTGKRLAKLPRLNMAQLPTPLEEAPRLSQLLGGPRIFFKRDDLTGVGLGGNKVRKLEFIIGRALQEGADTLVVVGGFQSNLARIATAMANRVGLAVELVLGGLPDEPRPVAGNLLLDQLLGARITYVDTVPRWEFGGSIDAVAEAVRRRGGRPFVMPLGGSGPEGMAGYVNAALEMQVQFEAVGIGCPDHLVVAVGSGGTYAGLLLGALNTPLGYTPIGISVSRTADYLLDKILESAVQAATVLGLEHAPRADQLHIYDDYIGAGYGAMTDACAEAIRMVARSEGILLDPVYSGKGMAGLIDLIRKGVIKSHETVVFLHTGGQPALFAYDAGTLLGSGA